MKPITKVYSYKNEKTGELVGKLFVSKPTSDSYSWKYPNCKLVDCIVVEKKSSEFLQKMVELIEEYENENI